MPEGAVNVKKISSSKDILKLMYFHSVQSETNSTRNADKWFVFHLVVTILSWIGPFLFSWYLMLTAYTLVMLQFFFFNRCLVNEKHALSENDDMTFYALLLGKVGFTVNKKKVKIFVRQYIYIVLGAFTIIWQLLLGFHPLIF